MTLPEVLLWQELRKRPNGMKFRRQHPIGPYVADFFCASAKMIVEIDGAIHDDAAVAARDSGRDSYLKAQGLQVIHIGAAEILRDAVGIASSLALLAARPLHHRASPGGPPPRERGGSGK